MTRSQALQILEKLLKLTDADSAMAALSGSAHNSTRLADNAITQNVAQTDIELRLTCAYGQSHGTATTNDFSPASLKALVARAQQIAKVSPADPEYMPPVEASAAKKYQKVKAHAAPTAKFSPGAKAKQLAGAVAMIRKKGLRLSGAYATGAYFRAFANSAGLRAYHRSTLGEIHATVLTPTGSGWAEKIANDVAAIDVRDVARRALAVADAAQNPQELPAQKYTVIMRPAAVAELLGFLLWGGFDAKATDEERTCLRGKLGKKICGPQISLYSRPSEPRCPGDPFQGDGLPAPALPWIEKGVLKNLFYSRFWAKKQGREATGWPTNVLMDGGEATVEKMIAGTERGLLITRFWYIRFVDPMIPLVTGMTRDGLFMIEKGKVGRAVKNLRFNENILDVLNRVEALSPPERTGEYMAMLMPALKVRDFNFTSATKF